MNEIKTPELNERWGMQVSLAGEVHINLKQMCITGSYSYYSCSPNISSPKLRSPWDDKVELVYITLSQQYLEQISSESETNTIESWFDLLGRNKRISGKAHVTVYMNLYFPGAGRRLFHNFQFLFVEVAAEFLQTQTHDKKMITLCIWKEPKLDLKVRITAFTRLWLKGSWILHSGGYEKIATHQTLSQNSTL